MIDFSKLISPITDRIISAIGQAIDELVTSEEEKLRLKNELEKIKARSILKQQEISLQFEQEVTKRWQTDKDGWLTRNTRPVIVLSLTAAFILLAFFSGAGIITLDPAWLPTFQQILIIALTAYFGSRGVEKVFMYKRGEKTEKDQKER